MHGYVFIAAGVLAVIAAIVAVTRENPIYTALATAGALACVAVEFLLLHAPFLAAMQILLYAGAIMVLFVFVIMLLSLRREELGHEHGGARKGFAFVVALSVFALLAYPAWTYPGHDGVARAPEPTPAALFTNASDFGSTEHMAPILYGEQLVPFELVSVLLTGALAGVMILARKRFGAPPRVVAAPSDAHPSHHHPHAPAELVSSSAAEGAAHP